jgi:hypothetical protein
MSKHSDKQINLYCSAVLRIRIRDPGLGAFLTPGSGIRDLRKSASGSGIRDEQSGSYFLELRNHFFAFFGVKILKFFDEDPGSGMETVRIWDPGWKKVGSGINIPDPPHCCSVLYGTVPTYAGTRCLTEYVPYVSVPY